MPSFTDGVYNIRNVGRGLMLDLKDNSTAEGNQIQGYKEDYTVAQQWFIKKQEEQGSAENSYTVQSNNQGYNGNGFFTAKQNAGEPVLYTREAFLLDLVPGVNDMYTISFTLGDEKLVFSIPRDDNKVELANVNSGDPYQQWTIVKST